MQITHQTFRLHGKRAAFIAANGNQSPRAEYADNAFYEADYSGRRRLQADRPLSVRIAHQPEVGFNLLYIRGSDESQDDAVMRHGGVTTNKQGAVALINKYANLLRSYASDVSAATLEKGPP
jgi:hypothetical protein